MVNNLRDKVQGNRAATTFAAPPSNALSTMFGQSSIKIVNLSVGSVLPDPNNPRGEVGDVTILAESIQEYGLQQPIFVRPEAGKYIVVEGNRRLAAMKQLRQNTISAIVMNVDADTALQLAVMLNNQRAELPKARLAALMRGLYEAGNSQRKIAAMFGFKSASTINAMINHVEELEAGATINEVAHPSQYETIGDTDIAEEVPPDEASDEDDGNISTTKPKQRVRIKKYWAIPLANKADRLQEPDPNDAVGWLSIRKLQQRVGEMIAHANALGIEFEGE